MSRETNRKLQTRVLGAGFHIAIFTFVMHSDF